MGVRFILGRSGTGKTAYCATRIATAISDDPLGPPILWLLPKQATFQAERHLTSLTGGFLRATVLSFDQLVERILQECGGGAIPEVTPLGRQMILAHLLRKHEKELRFFSRAARHPSLARDLASTLDEFDRAGRDPADVFSLLHDSAATDAEAALFHHKLHDLALLHRAYHAYLGQDRLDPARRLQQVLACADSSCSLRHSTVFVDSFLEFSDVERALLVRLARICPKLQITLLMDPALLPDLAAPHEISLFHKTQHTLHRLIDAFRTEGISVEPPLLFTQSHRLKASDLQQLESAWASRAAEPCSVADPSIALITAPDLRAEVDHAARSIRDLLASGHHLRDILLLVRRLDLYQHHIEASFRQHDIPYFVDRRRSMAHHPLLQFTRSLLAIARHNWPHHAVMVLLKTGLAGLSPDDADRLENYVLEHHLRHGAWTMKEPWKWVRRHTRASDNGTTVTPADVLHIDQLRRDLVERLAPLISRFSSSSMRHPLQDIVRDLRELLASFGVPQTLASWINDATAHDRLHEAAEHEQAWSELTALLDQLTALLGTELVDLLEFNEILDAALESIDLAITPPTVEQVLVGQVDRTRPPAVRCVFVLGLADGIFPFAPKDPTLLSDAERHELHRRELHLAPDTERRLLDEDLLAYTALTSASEKITVSRPRSDDAGRPLPPSPFWHRIASLFPHLQPLHLPSDPALHPDLIGTAHQLLCTLLQWARHPNTAHSTLPALFQFLTKAPGDSPITRLRAFAWPSLAYDNQSFLSPDLASALFPTPLTAPVAQLETFATCPYRHFLRFGLHLERRDESDSVSIDLDSVFHDILRGLVRDMLVRRTDWASLTPDQCRALIDQYTARAAQTLRGEIMLSNPRNHHLLARIEKTLEQVIAHQQAAAAHGSFRTSQADLVFADGDAPLPPLTLFTDDGKELRLTGRIDRVDIQDQGAVAVFDYRLHGGELSLVRVTNGLSLQLLTSLLVLQASGEKLTGSKLIPAAAFYVRLLRQLERVDHPAEAAEPDDPGFPLRSKQRGIFDQRFFESLDHAHDGKSSLVVNARLTKDGSLGYKAQSDFAESHEFAALLQQVARALARLGQQIMNGRIDIQPFRFGTETPCPRCNFRSVCRFDPALNPYHHIHGARRDQILQQAVEATPS